MLIRDNGLFADSYLPVADLDPRVADAALDALRDAGIAAYAKASPGVHGPYLDVHLPARPSDRLFVDSTAASTARSVLAGVLPNDHGGWEPVTEGEGTAVPAELVGAGANATRAAGEPDLDSVWEQIVAGFDAPTGDPVPPWPAEEDIGQADDDAAGAGAAEGAGRGGRVIRRVDAGDQVASDLDSADRDSADLGRADRDAAGPSVAEDEGHYVPPAPPPLPEMEPIARFAWAGVLGGPGFLLLAALLNWQLTPGIALVGVGAFLAGFVTLIARMKDEPPTDLGGDDGAVV